MFNLLLAAAAVSIGKVIGLVLIGLLIGLLLGAQITSHEERVHDYNLEDAELDELARIEKYASATGKAAIAKLKDGAARAKALEEKIAGDIRRRV
jgi:uncharacterized membrane protein